MTNSAELLTRAGLAMALTGAGSAFSQSGSAGAESIWTLPDVVVQANHFDALAVDLPIQLTRIDRDWIERAPAPSLRALLESQNGIHMQSYTGSPQNAEISLRGFGSAASQRVLVLVDGVPLNRPDLAAINWSLIPLETIESIEILRGAQTVLYGDHAVAGVVHVRTRVPATAQSTFSVDAGSDGLWAAHARSSLRPWGHGFAVSAGLEQADGYRDNSHYETGYVHLSGVLHDDQEPRHRFSLQYSSGDQQYPGPIVSEGFPEDPRDSVFDDQNAREDAWLGSWQSTIPLGMESQMMAQLVGQYRDLESSFSGNNGATQITTVRSTLRARSEWRRIEFQTGVEAHYERLQFDQFFRPESEQPFSRSDLAQTNLSSYLYADYPWNETIRLHLGSRLALLQLEADRVAGSRFAEVPTLAPDFRDSKSDTEWAVTTGLVYRPHSALRSYFRVDRLFRFPAVDETVAFQDFELAKDFNDTLQPETGWQAELGGELAWRALLLQANLFLQELDNEIDFDPQERLNINLPPTRRQGLELSASARAGPWEASLEYAYTDARYRGGNYAGEPRYLVPHHSFAATSYLYIHDNAQLSITGRYISEQRSGNDFRGAFSTLPSYAVVDASLQLRVTSRLRLRVIINNVLDRDFATVKYLNTWYPAPGRTLRASLQARF